MLSRVGTPGLGCLQRPACLPVDARLRPLSRARLAFEHAQVRVQDHARRPARDHVLQAVRAQDLPRLAAPLPAAVPSQALPARASTPGTSGISPPRSRIFQTSVSALSAASRARSRCSFAAACACRPASRSANVHPADLRQLRASRLAGSSPASILRSHSSSAASLRAAIACSSLSSCASGTSSTRSVTTCADRVTTGLGFHRALAAWLAASDRSDASGLLMRPP